MAPKYKLSYYPARWLAEPARFIFAYAGQEYEDHRFTGEEWKDIKPTTPFGQAPILYVDDVAICQSKAICRYLAKQFGLMGKTDLDQAKGDMIADYVEDFKKPVMDAYMIKDEAEKKATYEKFYSEGIFVYLNNFEKILKENNGGDGFFTGSEVTWVDLFVVHFVDMLTGRAIKESEGKFNLDSCPKLKALIERVQALPAIAAWIKKRPESEF